MLFRLLCWITTIPPFQNFKLSFSKHFCSLSYNIFLPNKSFLFPASEWFFVSFNILVLHSSWVHIWLIEIYFKTSLRNRYFTGSVEADWIISICHYQYKMTSEVERFRSKMFPRNGHLIIESRNSNNFPNIRTWNLFPSKWYFPLTYSYYKKTEKG